jgi:hypothetical protein
MTALTADMTGFILQVVSPIFRFLATEVDKKGGSGMEISRRIGYDDANECFCRVDAVRYATDNFFFPAARFCYDQRLPGLFKLANSLHPSDDHLPGPGLGHDTSPVPTHSLSGR